jgi:DNA-binding response OmpR family regulator
MNTSEHSSNTRADRAPSILLVDDDDDVRKLLSCALETAGFEVVAVGNLLDLQRRLAHTRPDALVIDLQRSELDGLRLLTRIRARHNLCEVPIVFLAGTDDDDFRCEVLRAGADRFALRPVPLLELQSAVGELLRGGRAVTEAGLSPRRRGLIRRLRRTG